MVHGLGGNPSSTWKHESGYFWPWELRNFVPDARVMLFGYDADIAQGLSSNLALIKDFASCLLGSLVNKRQDDQVRACSVLDRPPCSPSHFCVITDWIAKGTASSTDFHRP